MCAELDAMFLKYGQVWIVPRLAVNMDAAVTVQEAAEFAGVTVFAIYKWISSGKLKVLPKEADGLTRVTMVNLLEIDAEARKLRKGPAG